MHSLEVLQARNFQKITLQRIFDAGWQAFVVEGKPWAVDPITTHCKYDDGKGNCCAVGLCVPPAHPIRDPRTGGVASRHRFTYPDLFEHDNPDEQLDELQRKLHDDLAHEGYIPGSPEVRAAYLAVANRFKLQVPE